MIRCSMHEIEAELRYCANRVSYGVPTANVNLQPHVSFFCVRSPVGYGSNL